jgi:hypothetical protein
MSTINIDELRTYIPFAIAREGWTFAPDGSVSPNPNNLPPGWFPANLYETYKADVRNANREAGRAVHKHVTYADFRRVFDMVQDEGAHALKYGCVDALRFSGIEDLAPLRQFVKAVLGTLDETAVMVFAHFIANVKRKMTQQAVTYQLMPILTGKQKGGKSTAVRKLLSPLGETVHETTITSSLKAENFMMFSQFFVVFFDEMEGIQKTSIAALKKMITEERAGGRVFYTQRNVNLANLCSFVGTANDSAMELIDDKTGARRFFEILCADKLDWSALNAIDYGALWRGIDENTKSKYYLLAEAEIDRRQQNLVSVDMFNMFLQETHLQPEAGEPETEGKWISSKTFYKVYSDWLEPYRATPLHPATFFKKLTAAGFEKRVQNVGQPVLAGSNMRRTTTTVYRISSHTSLTLDTESVVELLAVKLAP